MRITSLVVTAGLCAAGQARAGGLFLPGAGAESTSRAGAGLVSADDGEALVENPAGFASAPPGIQITLTAAALDYVMHFTRHGDYDAYDQQQQDQATAADNSYVGQRYPTVYNKAKPPLGLGAYQPVPVIAISSDLGGKVRGLHIAAGLYAPNAYPFRDMTHIGSADRQWTFNSQLDQPPPPTRYDIEKQDAKILVPSIAAAYRIADRVDVGARVGLAFTSFKSTVAVWAVPGNYSEWVQQDGNVSFDAKDNGELSWQTGGTFHVTDAIDVSANYTSSIAIHAKGTATAEVGAAATLAGTPLIIAPVADEVAKCAKGGTMTALRACADFSLPQNAQLGARYKFLDDHGNFRGDVELDLDWENWGNNENNYNVTIDAQASPATAPQTGIPLKPSVIYHGFQDTYAARLGGSYVIPLPASQLIVRGGIGYDTAAAKDGWERVDIDGAARTTIAAGVGYRLSRFQVDAGFGVILEGARTNSGTCNPTAEAVGCDGTNTDAPQGSRKGPDPTNPIVLPTVQAQDPVNQGVIASHYYMMMLGVKTWF